MCCSDRKKLHPELAPYVSDGKHTKWPVLQHPLIYAVPYVPQYNAHLNQVYAYKVKALAEAREKGDWPTTVWLHERPYRWHALREIEGELDGKAWHALLRSVWEDSENIWQQGDGPIRYLFRAKRRGRKYLMEPAERSELAALPERITIYRGCKRGLSERGWSWTLDLPKARWFAQRLLRKGEKPCVLAAEVERSKVIMLCLGRGEHEIVIDPRDLPQKHEIKRLTS